MNLFLCLTLAEWKNLCSKGRISTQTSRIFEIQNFDDNFLVDEFFSSIPERHAIGASVDYIVAEIFKNEKDFDVVGENTKTTQVIKLANVIAFFPLQDQDEWNFSGDAEKIDIKISKSRLENQWLAWTKNQLRKEATRNGLLLQELFNLESNEDQTLDNLSYGQICDLLKGDVDVTVDPTELTVKIIRSFKEFFNVSQEDFDKNSFWISNVIAYINTNSTVDFFEKNPESASIALDLHERYFQQDFSLKIKEEVILISYLETLKNEASFFNEFWSPLTIVLFTRLKRRIEFAKPKPEEIIENLLFIKDMVGKNSAQLLTFMVGVLLGSNKVHSIERIIQPQKFSVALDSNLKADQ
jgi:hypothetical protein